jgi:transposase
MARYKYIDANPRFLAVALAKQRRPGTFEHALNHLLEGAIDLSPFDGRFRNDVTGAPAYPPAMLLKVVLFAYSQGIVSSRGIERACQDHVTFIALCGDTAPHFTTIAQFVSTLGDAIAKVFAGVLAVCDAQGLIGREMFATDGVKLPSNASKHRSGTRAAFEQQATKLETAAAAMLARPGEADELPAEPELAAKAKARVAQLERDAEQLRDWLAAHPSDRPGARGGTRQSNRTDNESATMATSKGVMQGYTGVAAVDATHQIIVEAQAHGTGSEQEVLMPVVAALQPLLAGDTYLTADAGYHSEANLQQLAALKITALIADPDMRKRDGAPCPLRAQCLRTPDTTPVRNVAFFRGPSDPPAINQTALMKVRLDTPEGRAQYAQRFAAVEPVFGNVRYNKGRDRFTLRGRAKVDAQWKLFCLVHNIEKLANTGYAAYGTSHKSYVSSHLTPLLKQR